MKRDMELVRNLILAIESSTEPLGADDLAQEGYTEEQVGHHLWLLTNGGFIMGADSSSRAHRTPQAVAKCLTWAGHEFADAARSDTVWKRTVSKVKESVGTATIGVLTEMLKQSTLSMLGLHNG